MTTDDDTGVPNLDDCDPDELEQHISAFGALQRYGELRRFARDARLAGQMPRAQQLEARMQAIYSSLPAWAKW